MKTTEIKKAYDVLCQAFYSANRNYARDLFDMCKAEEKSHRGFGDDWANYHAPFSIADAAKLFTVKRVAEYLLQPETAPKAQDYIHTQKSCYMAAAIAFEFKDAINEAWKLYDVVALSNLDYCQYVKKAA